jgi:hypothetical protein
LFHRKTKSIVPYSNSLPNTNNDNKIKPSNSLPSKISESTTGKLLTTDILESMRNTQMITNAEFMTLALLKKILLILNQIEINTAQTAVNTPSSAISSEFVGRLVSNKFKLSNFLASLFYVISRLRISDLVGEPLW